MSGQGTSNISLFSIASIRNSIVAKINASDSPVNNPVKDKEIVSPTKQSPSITSKLESDDNIDGFPVTVSNFNKKSPPVKRDTDASADESEEVTAADSIRGTLQTKKHCQKTDDNLASTVASDAIGSSDGAMNNAMDVETSSTSESALNSPATNVPATDQQSEIISEVAENGRVTGKGQNLGRSFESNGPSQSTSETSTFHSVIIKTEIEDYGYPCDPQQCTDGNEDDAYNDNDVPRAFDSAVSVIKTEVVDNKFPFQGDLMLTSTDFSQLIPESTESMIIKQEMPDSCSEDIGEQTDEDVAITRVEYRLADSDGEREEDSSSDSSSDIEFPAGRHRASDEDDEFFGKPFKKNRYGFDDIRTNGEVLPEELPPIEGLTIDIGEDTELQEIGIIDSIVGVLVIVRSSVEHSPLQDDTVFFLENRKPIGHVFETMGQVRMPFYSIRFNSLEEITERGVEIGKKVLFAPTVAEITHYVFVAQLKRLKGSDASWENNNEPPQTHVEYSDDEKERLAKAKRRGRKKNAANGDGAGSSSDSDNSDSEETKAKRPNKKHGDGENRGRGRGRRGRNFCAGRGGGGDAQPNTTDQPSGRWPPSDWSSKRFTPSSRPPHFDWDQPGSSAPPPRPPPTNQNYNIPCPWNMGGPGNGVLQMPRFPPAQFCPRPSGPNMWGPPPPPPFAPPVSGPNCGPPPFRPPPPPSPVNGMPPAFQGGPPFSRPGPPPSPHSPHPGNVPPVFNPNIPPPPYNPSVSPSPFSMPPPSPNSSQFGSQPNFTSAPWGSGGQGAPFWVSSPQGTVTSTHSGPLYSSQGQQSSGCFSVSSSAPATQGTVVSSMTATVMSSVASKRPVLDTRYMQNSGE